MKKNQTISLMEQMENERKKEERDKSPKPFLIKRIWSGILDLILLLILSFGFEYLIYNFAFKAIGYHQIISDIHQLYDDSSLYYVDEKGNYLEYDESANLDSIIITYYQNDAYAKEYNRYDKYLKAKEDSELFVKDENGTFVLKDDVKNEDVNDFYLREYNNAITCFDSNPIYQSYLNRLTSLEILSLIISFTLGSAIIYLLVPLLRKEGETISQIINKLCIIDARDMSKIKKWQIVLRYVIILLFNIYLPILLLYKYDTFNPISIMISILMICITKNNIGPHEYLSQSMVILKRRSDAFDTLKAIRGR